MFWRIPNFSASSPVETILDKESFTLEELLDEEEIIQECKALNTRLINFLRDRAQVEQLVQYIVEDASEDAESKRTFKFPFIACEVFTCEIDVILKTLVEDEEVMLTTIFLHPLLTIIWCSILQKHRTFQLCHKLFFSPLLQLMDMLFSFLEPNHTHNSLLAGYFSKVVVCLMLRKTTSLMKYVQTHERIFCQLVDLIGVTSIMEILVRLVGADDHLYPNFMDVMQWLSDSNLLEMIVDKLNSSFSPEVHANAAEVLGAIIRNAPSALAAKLASPSFVARIFGHALDDSPSKSALVYSLSVCISLLDPKRSTSAVVHSFRSQHLYEPSIHVDPGTISAMLPKLGILLTMLDVSSAENILPTTYGELRPPLGKHRLKNVEFIAVLLGTGDEAAEKELVNSGAIQRILDLFFEYPFNNSLHHHVESIITACLDSKNIAIIDHLFQDCNIIGKFLQADKDPSLTSDSNLLTKPAAGRQPPRVGYIGHITRIANKLVQLGNCNDHIQRYLQENSEWNDWQINVLQERNTAENVYRWACGRPTALQDRTRDSDEDEINDRDYDVTALANNLSQAFRYNSYDNDADEDVYFDDESAEVVISSLRLGDDHESNLFTNSNWFAFQEDRSIEESLSTSSLDRMEDISLNGTASGSKEMVSGEDRELSDAADSSGTHSDLGGNSTTNGLVDQPSTGPEKGSALDDMGVFRFETGANDDLFNDQQLPDWVGWREPSDIQVDSTDDVTTTADAVESSLPNGVDWADANPASTSEPSEAKTKGTVPSLFEEDAEFVGVDLESPKKSIITKSLEMEIPDEDKPGMMEFNKNHWRAEPEVGVVQE